MKLIELLNLIATDYKKVPKKIIVFGKEFEWEYNYETDIYKYVVNHNFNDCLEDYIDFYLDLNLKVEIGE